MNTQDIIYREINIEPTQEQSVAFLQSVAISGTKIVSSYAMSNAFPPSAVNRWTMFFKLAFEEQEEVEKFDALILSKLGKVSIESETVTGAQSSDVANMQEKSRYHLIVNRYSPPIATYSYLHHGCSTVPQAISDGNALVEDRDEDVESWYVRDSLSFSLEIVATSETL